MLYLKNKYTTWYYNIIKKASGRVNIDCIEKHHIIPRALGGDNSAENVIDLTPREHFLCHLLLTKMLTGNFRYKMIFALSMLMKVKNIGEGRYITTNSRIYEYARRSFREALTNYWTDENRKIHSEKISKVTKGRIVSEETKEKHRNRVWTNDAIQNRLNNCLTASASRKGKSWSTNMRKARENSYFKKNLELSIAVFEMTNRGIRTNAIATSLNVDWMTVKTIINRRAEFETYTGKKI